jgi:hypothetical protein
MLIPKTAIALILKIPLMARITFMQQSFNSVERNFVKLLIRPPGVLECSPNIVGSNA